jgi:hypothetical protein
LVEAMVYVVLQFWTFADHDYYTIDMYILLILIVVTAFDLLKRLYYKIFSSLVVKIAFFLFLLFNIYYAGQKITERYTGWMNDFPKNKDIYTITPYLRQIGILPNDTVISIPDISHASLYLMNQKGWTEYTDERFSKQSKIRYNQDSAGIQRSIDKGAKYLILNGIEELYKKPYLQSYCNNLKGRYNDVLIFDLGSKIRNFNIQEPVINKTYKCNAEIISNDRQNFISETDSTVIFQNGENQSNEFTRSGKYSCKLSENKPFGMTIRFNDLKVGESLEISVWRKAKSKTDGCIVVSANSETPYYNTESKVLETDGNGWEKIAMKIFITSELAGHELGIYIYNPKPEPVYFDDFEIIRYRSVLESNGK